MIVPVKFTYEHSILSRSPHVCTFGVCRAVVRSPDKYKEAFDNISVSSGLSLDVVAGDVTDPASLQATLRGCDGGVVYAASASSYFGSKAVDNQVPRTLSQLLLDCFYFDAK